MTIRSVDLANELHWRSFAALDRKERESLEKLCGGGDFSALEFSCVPGTTNFCVISSPAGETWNWTVFGTKGEVLDQGVEVTRAAVIRAAADSQPLWLHRCSASGGCSCSDASRR